MPLLHRSYGAVLFVVVHRHHSRVGLLLVASFFWKLAWCLLVPGKLVLTLGTFKLSIIFELSTWCCMCREHLVLLWPEIHGEI